MTSDRFRLLHLRRMMRHRLRTLASVVGIGVGVALVVSTAALGTSATASAEATVALLGGAQLEVTVPAGGVETSIDSIVAVDGITSVGRYVESPIMIDGTQAWLVALSNPDADLTTTQARSLAATTGIRTGSQLPSSGEHIFTGPGGTPTSADIDGQVDSPLAGRYAGWLVATDLATAEALRGPVGTETLLVYGKPNRAEIAAAVPGSHVRPTGDRVAQARNSMAVFFQSISLLGGMGLVIGGFMLFNTMNMTVLERRHEIASLRALGATRRSILTGVLTEAAALGVLSSALGLGLGVVLARLVLAAVPDAFTRAIGTPLQLSVPWWLLAIGWLIGVATAALSAIPPARRAIRVEPLDALRPDLPDPTQHRVVARLWLVVLGTAMIVFAQGQIGMGLAMVGLLCIAAGAAPAIVSACVAVASWMGPSGELAAASLRRSPRRVWGTTTVVILAVAIAVTTTGMAINMVTTTNRNLSTILNSDFWIGTSDGETIALTGLPTEWAEEFAEVPGVRAVAGSMWVPAESGDQIVGIQGVEGDSGYPFSRLASDAARVQMAAGKGAIVLKQTALEFGYSVGDMIDIPGAVPPLRLPIVAITDAIVPTGGGMINISHDLLARHYGIASLSRYEIQLADDADRVAVRERLEQITAPAGPQVQIYSGEVFLEQIRSSPNQILSLIAMMIAVIVGCAAIAVLNTLLASTLERTAEIATLRAIGGTKRRIATTIAAEALAMGVTGAAIGAAVGSVSHFTVVRIYRDISAFDIDYSFSPVAFVAAIVTGIAIAAIGAITPCRAANRLDILDALGS